MTVTTITSREFNQDTGRAKIAAKLGPVIITDRGHNAHVLLSYDEFLRISSRQQNLAELLAMPGADEIDFDPPRMNFLAKPVDLA